MISKGMGSKDMVYITDQTPYENLAADIEFMKDRLDIAMSENWILRKKVQELLSEKYLLREVIRETNDKIDKIYAKLLC